MEEPGPSVIIVGAGAAGIAAASKLLQNNIRNIIILEAEDRIGGRIHSVKFGDSMVDLGAQWCQGEFSIVHHLVENYNLLILKKIRSFYYYSSGTPVDQNFATELFTTFLDIYYSVNLADERKGLSMGDYVTHKYKEAIHERYACNEEQLKFANEFLQIIDKMIRITHGAFTSSKPSAERSPKSAGAQLLHWNGHGFKMFLNCLMNIYPNPDEKLPVLEKTRFNKEVVRIQWHSDILVECSDDSKFTADHVIVTASLGVLKHRHGSLFDPRLPKEKTDAIEELGMGAVVKILLYFPLKWWTDSMEFMRFIWSEQDKLEIMKTISDDDELGQSWILDLFAVSGVDRNPNVRLAWFVGKNVPKIERFSDDKIIDGIMHVLTKFVGPQCPNLARPNSIRRENWYSNPNFRGTYSYESVDSCRREISGRATLSQPLFTGHGCKSVLFAGEATHSKYYATVHGAVETGFREAERIINLYK